LLLAVPELPRVRLSSIDPAELDDDLLSVFGDQPRLMPHIHISVQAGDDMILKRMKRRHLRHDVITFCDKVRAVRPDVVFGADFIAGFPTETDDMFQNTMALVEECGLTHLHVFPYSIRPGTPAAKMPQVNGALIKDRAAQLRNQGQRAMARFLETQIGRAAHVLVERDGLGHSEHYVPVRLDGVAAGELVAARIVSVDGSHLIGQPLDA
jgi:threonylcarbamoyladenosine tRNA methylthiotransferase MtaB